MAAGVTLDEARRIAEAALHRMAELEIPPTPANFAVWFAYAGGTNPHLCRTLDALVDGGHPVDAARNADMYDRFILPSYRSSAVDTLADDLHAVAGSLTTTVGDVRDGALRYRDALTSATELLERGDAGPTRELVDGLVHETRIMEARNARLRERLERSSGEIARLRESLEETRREASTDGLTAIANRARFERELRSAAAEASESGATLCLLMADIDHFKRFNDRHGHAVGDQVLRLVARVLSEAIRPADLAARYGGEEFAVILPDCALDEAAGIAERIRERIGQRHVVRRSNGDDLGAVTLSIGVTAHRAGEAITDALERADAGLYRAKQSGRNRVALVPPPPAAAAP